MPQIEGLKEAQDALARIKHYLKDIDDINNFLKNVSTLSKDASVSATHSILITFTSGADIKKFKSPMEVSDNQFIFDAVRAYKESIVAKVKKDSSDFHIALSPKDIEILDWAPPVD